MVSLIASQSMGVICKVIVAAEQSMETVHLSFLSCHMNWTNPCDYARAYTCFIEVLTNWFIYELLNANVVG